MKTHGDEKWMKMDEKSMDMYEQISWPWTINGKTSGKPIDYNSLVPILTPCTHPHELMMCLPHWARSALPMTPAIPIKVGTVYARWCYLRVGLGLALTITQCTCCSHSFDAKYRLPNEVCCVYLGFGLSDCCATHDSHSNACL